MSDWDFLWGLEGKELEDAMSSGCTYSDLEYIERHEEEEEEEARIEKRNLEWKNLKRLRDSQAISPDEFKKRKAEIFYLENRRKFEAKQYKKELKQIASTCISNRNGLQNSIMAGCFSCTRVFTVYEIKEYTDDTAICPYCGNKTVLSSEHGGKEEAVLRDIQKLLNLDKDEN